MLGDRALEEGIPWDGISSSENTLVSESVMLQSLAASPQLPDETRGCR